MAARDAARIHIQISRCAAAHRVFFFPFASLISTVHLSLEGMEKKEGISINEEIDPFAEKDFTWMIWFTIQRKMKFS